MSKQMLFINEVITSDLEYGVALFLVLLKPDELIVDTPRSWEEGEYEEPNKSYYKW